MISALLANPVAAQGLFACKDISLGSASSTPPFTREAFNLPQLLFQRAYSISQRVKLIRRTSRSAVRHVSASRLKRSEQGQANGRQAIVLGLFSIPFLAITALGHWVGLSFAWTLIMGLISVSLSVSLSVLLHSASQFFLYRTGNRFISRSA
jgi:hypothetical protein